MFTAELGNSFADPFAFGVGLDLEYKELSLFTRITALGGETTEEISNRQGMVWEKGKPANTFHGELSLGYALLDNEKFKISPFVGVGVSEINAPEDDLKENPDLEHLALGSDVAYSFGANMDFKLGWKTGEIVENDKTYWYLRIRYGYVMPQFSGSIQGNMHIINIGLGGVIHGIKREL